MVVPGEGITMLNLNAACHREIVAREMIEGFDFEPRCLVLVLAEENERALFDSMLAAGRTLSDPFVREASLEPRTQLKPNKPN